MTTQLQKQEKQKTASQDESSSLRLFNRVYTLTIWRQNLTEGFSITPGFFDKPGAGIEISLLRVKFEIKKTLAKEPNHCVVTVINLAPDSRAALEFKPLYATLRAGYDGVDRLLFSGNVMHASSTLKAPNWETKMQISDGGRAYAHGFHSRSYRKPVTVRRVLADAAGTMGLQLPKDVDQTPELKQALADGLSVHGPSRDTLTKILAPYGYGWSVQNGVLTILRDGDVLPSEVRLIDGDAGLINSPELSVPKKIGDPVELSLQVKLFPELNCGQLIQVESRAINGVFRIKEVHHKGDTRGKEFTTALKAVPNGQSLTKHRRKR